ncbi:MAG TPA: hypothetical protein VHI52_13190 [Verrucomicrobiae bacterium]|nr:hypothetical protein [Verrucomicrobiae bacterium]
MNRGLRSFRMLTAKKNGVGRASWAFLRGMRDKHCTCRHNSILPEHHALECGWYRYWVNLNRELEAEGK